MRDIEFVRFDTESVSRSLALQPGTIAPERLTETRDVDMKRVARPFRRVALPQILDEPIGRDGPIRVNEEADQESPLPRRTQLDSIPVLEDLKHTKDREVRTHLLLGA
jgi:hypothetical protein